MIRFLSMNKGLVPVAAALALLAAGVSSASADVQSAQDAVQAHLPAGKTILTAKASDLLAAVDAAIALSGSAKEIADSVLQPVPPTGTKKRSDAATTLPPLLTGSAIAVSSADATASADIAATLAANLSEMSRRQASPPIRAARPR